MQRFVFVAVALLVTLAGALAPGPALAATPQASAEAGIPVDLLAVVTRDSDFGSDMDTQFLVQVLNGDPTAAAVDVKLTVAMPQGATFVRATKFTAEEIVPDANVAGILTFLLGTLPKQTIFAFELVLHLPPMLPGTPLSISAGVQSTNPDPDPANNFFEESFELPATNLSIALWPAMSGSAPVAGHQTTFSLSYLNSSALDAHTTVCTVDLAPGLTLHRATLLQDGRQTPLQPTVSGNRLTFNLGTVASQTFAEIHLLLDVASSVRNGRLLFTSAAISTPDIESRYEDNRADYAVKAIQDAPDLWVQMTSRSGEQVNAAQLYVVDYGNSGVQPAPNAHLELTLPAQMTGFTFDPAPDSVAGSVARWELGTLAPSDSSAGEIWINGTIQSTGVATATATIASSTADGYLPDNTATVANTLVALRPPTLGGPLYALISPTPVLFGRGEPGALVSVWVSDTVSVRDLGTTTVDLSGDWVYTVTEPLRPFDWSWLLVDQELDGRLSQPVTAPSWVSDTLPIDPNSLTLNGERWGGLEQMQPWSIHIEYRIGMRITQCAAPYDHALRIDSYNDADQLVNSVRLVPVATGPQGYVEYAYLPLEGIPFVMTAEWSCPTATAEGASTEGANTDGATALSGSKGRVVIVGGETWWYGDDGRTKVKLTPKPKPRPKVRPPNNPCLTPLEARPNEQFDTLKCKWVPKSSAAAFAVAASDATCPPPDYQDDPVCFDRPPKPEAIDPDGYVYDAGMVTGGAPVAQALVAGAWVTATREVAPGLWEPWDAGAYEQINPQYTDGEYPDKVLKVGYYAFFVPPGNYRVQVTAPGYAPYITEILTVISYPITRHIGLIPLGGGARYAPLPKLYLPAVLRQ